MRIGRIIMLAILIGQVLTIRGQQNVRRDVLLLDRICQYRNQIDTSMAQGTQTYAYRKFGLNVVRRNVILFPIPTMYRIAHSKNRRYIEESYELFSHKSTYDFDATRIAHLSTIPQHKQTMTRLQKFLTPKFYEETIFGSNVLSPFCKANRVFYRYHFKYLYNNKVDITFWPKVKNTQLVYGNATIDAGTGRIINGSIQGEFDMITFALAFTMGDSGIYSLFPTRCTLNSKFEFLGNIIQASNVAAYGLPKVLADSQAANPQKLQIAAVRCDSLTADEQQLYAAYYHDNQPDSATTASKKRGWAKRFFWDILGDNLLNKITSSYGTTNQGYLRINPLFNPLYMGYSGHKGYYYKFDIRTTYTFSNNSYLYTRLKAGYSFKQRHLYYTIPVEYHFNHRHNGYIELRFSNGNWIRNGLLKDELLSQLPDTANYNDERLSYFRDLNLSLLGSYDLNPHITLQAGIVAHRRTAVEQDTYRRAGLHTSYYSFAPKTEMIWRPGGQHGPAINAAYERSIRGLANADIAYERWEFDLQHIIALNRLRYLSLRAGGGFYTLRDGSKYFLDYTNFRDNNIPDGWNDEWTGEFSLLDSKWYNLSRYYVRSNITYETPLLALSRLPWVGHIIEKERIYSNILVVTHLHPYIEVGYGLTTRWLSAGLFVANRNGHYDGIGVKVGLELFRQW